MVQLPGIAESNQDLFLELKKGLESPESTGPCGGKVRRMLEENWVLFRRKRRETDPVYATNSVYPNMALLLEIIIITFL